MDTCQWHYAPGDTRIIHAAFLATYMSLAHGIEQSAFSASQQCSMSLHAQHELHNSIVIYPLAAPHWQSFDSALIWMPPAAKKHDDASTTLSTLLPEPFSRDRMSSVVFTRALLLVAA